ncbi:basement membrane-specific heparan sulfate proteoglycan core protein-like [Mytilus edulis]|uniref:basement membrane-specific heparan sulfate proteoglycan core protein-like n=1 Tax=Mytilus edulis TaxID=6550 RepID=UPI0039F0F8E9
MKLRVSGNVESTLSILWDLIDVTFEESGQYRCHAENDIATGESDPVNVTVYGGVPNVTIPNSDYSSGHGWHLQLECSIESTPNHTNVYWQKQVNGTVINITSSSPGFYGSTIGLPSLIIFRVSTDGAGQYTCFAVNLVGTGKSQTTTLKVLGGVPNVTIPNLEYSSGHGWYKPLECMIDSFPNHTDVYWQKLSNDIVTNITSSSPGFEGATVTSPSLNITHVSTDDAGQYTCFAANIVGTGKSKPTTLTVLGGDVLFNTSIINYTEVYGSDITLSCSVTFETIFGPVRVSWRNYNTSSKSFQEYPALYGNDHVTFNNHSIAIPEKNGFTMSHYFLTITTLSFKDDGWYYCKARDQFSIGSSHFIQLQIIGGIPNVTIPNLNYSTGSGRHFVLECMITSVPDHHAVYWQKLSNGTVTNITSSSPGYDGATDTSPSLNITQVSTNDAGQYMCFAVNFVGIGSSQVTTLTVVGGDIVVNCSKTNYTEVYGSHVTLHCSVTYETKFGPVNVTWFKSNQSGISVPVQPSYYGYGHVTLSNHSVTIPEKDGFKMDRFFLEIRSLNFRDDDIPVVHLEPGPFNASRGSNITLKCNITSVPTHFNVYWESVSNGVTTTWHLGETYRESDEGETHSESVALLVLDNASSSDSGQYICFAENVLGTGKSKPVNVTIYGDQNHPKVNIQSNQYFVKDGSPLTIASSVRTTELNPVSEVYWQFNNNGVITKISEETDGINGSTIQMPSLTILNVTSSESGIYTFYAKNDIETGQSRPIHVIITGGVPKVSVIKPNYTAGYGETVTMFCNMTSDPIVTNVYWEKEFNGSIIVIDNLTTGIQGISVDAPSITIVTTTTSDIGNYRCIAINDVGTGCSETTRLEVIGELPSVSITTSLSPVNYGEKVHIACVVTGNPPPTQLYWEKEFNDIKTVIHNGTINTEGITPENPSLILLYATDSDEGLYKCFAVNEFGRDSSSSVELNVVGAKKYVRPLHVEILPMSSKQTYSLSVTCTECMNEKKSSYTRTKRI